MGSFGAIVLLPILISGYVFNTIFYPLRYFTSQAEGQKLFFLAAGSGLLISSFVFVVGAWIASFTWFNGSWIQWLAHGIDSSIPIPKACLLLLTVFVSAALGFFLNFLIWLRYGNKDQPVAKRVYNKLTDRFGNSLCQILRRGADRQKLVLLNLKSRKVYCGRVLEVPPNIELDGSCVELLPIFSGYRDKDTLRFGAERTEYPVIALWEAKQYAKSRAEVLKEFDRIIGKIGTQAFDPEELATQREALVSEIDEAGKLIAQFNGPAEINLEDWVKVFPIAEIESASFYDAEAYMSWFDRKEAPREENRTDPLSSD